MLNLTALFSMRPAPVIGGRLVKGSAMSGSPVCNDIPPPALEREIESRPVEAKSIPLPPKSPPSVAATRRKFEAAMKGKDWMTGTELCKALHLTKGSVTYVLRRLLRDGMVEMKRQYGTGKERYRTRYLWRWVDDANKEQ